MYLCGCYWGKDLSGADSVTNPTTLGSVTEVVGSWENVELVMKSRQDGKVTDRS